MELKSLGLKLTAGIKKYRYAIIILLIGICLMYLPFKKNEPEIIQTVETEEAISINDMLSEILSSIAGAGDVKVLLTVAKGEEILYQSNASVASSETGNNTQSNTVTVTDAQRNENGLVRQINPPVYQGAIIACQGADSPSVRLAIVNAVSKVTGLGADQISVLKMK